MLYEVITLVEDRLLGAALDYASLMLGDGAEGAAAEATPLV